jgi:dipeptidyl aminopeptidase/acylaminoacyl peptidase
MKRYSSFFLALVCVLCTLPLRADSDLTLDDLFRDKPLTGKSARSAEWSHDDRYLGYLWNGYDDHGMDLWVYDTKTKRSSRVTTIEMMAAFDRDLPAVIERYKKEKAEDIRRQKLTQEERKKLEDEDKKKREESKEPIRDYGGISGFEWANTKDEVLFEYRGDIYRIAIGSNEPSRLTKTQDGEGETKWLKDDSGFFFRRGGGVYKMHFDSPYVEELNPPLPNNLPMGSYSISPDESKMMISASRSKGQSRQVTYISYRDRFATARTTQREVGDDPFNDEEYLFLYDLTKDDGKPWEIYHWAGGMEYQATSVSEDPWSPDSKKFVFVQWKRTQQDLDVIVADFGTHKTATVYTVKHTGGSNSPGMAQPMFTKDGSKIVTLLETSGFRHAWLVDPITKGAMQLTRGNFEVYPQKLTDDGKSLIATSWKEDSTRMDVYLVDLQDGSMKRLTHKVGAYGEPEMSHDFKKFATSFRSWKDLNELYVIDGGDERKLTDSHKSDDFWKVMKILPVAFSFKNRHGQTVHGMAYFPKDFKKTDKRPLFLYTYGGPLGTSKDVVEGNYNTFNMYLTYNLGYVTATIDPRGMSGYGSAFEAANFGAPGVPQVEDLTDGVKYLISQGGIDDKEVGINGWSFGGFQTQMCMYTAPDVFSLGIAGAGPTQWQNYNNWYTRGVIGPSRESKPEDLDKYSLTKLAKNLKGHLMLLHGMEDTNVLFQDTIKVYQALLQAGKGPLVELVVDPTGGHGLGGDIKTKDRYAIYEAFLRQIWGPYEPEAGIRK